MASASSPNHVAIWHTAAQYPYVLSDHLNTIFSKAKIHFDSTLFDRYLETGLALPRATTAVTTVDGSVVMISNSYSVDEDLYWCSLGWVDLPPLVYIAGVDRQKGISSRLVMTGERVGNQVMSIFCSNHATETLISVVSF
jgi:hypothetical protein